MRNDRASRRYAQALFSLAVDHGRIDEVSEDLDRAVRALDELPGVRSLFTQPLMPDRIKRDLVDKVFGDSISQLTRDFLHVVVARNRGDLFDQIRERYIELCNDYHGILPASVQSAVPLSESELAELSARLGLVEASLVPRLRTLCQRAGLPVQAPPLSVLPVDRWMALMRVDKKAEGGEIRFVVIDGLGRAAVRAAPDALVAEVIAAHAAPG